jgi:hypothetical protein
MNTVAILLLLLQLSPPTATIKRRHGTSARVAWDLPANPNWKVVYFSLKATSDLGRAPVEIQKVPAADRVASFTVSFDPQSNKYMYYVVSAVYEGASASAESFPSNSVMVERIGPPPSP